MEEYINKIDKQLISNQALAFIGDAVYNLYIKMYLASISNRQAGLLHKESIGYVSARAQSKIVDNILPILTQQESEVYHRGRNTSIATVSKNVDVVGYKKATGLEALFGMLYIEQNTERLEQLIELSINIIEEHK